MQDTVKTPILLRYQMDEFNQVQQQQQNQPIAMTKKQSTSASDFLLCPTWNGAIIFYPFFLFDIITKSHITFFFFSEIFMLISSKIKKKLEQPIDFMYDDEKKKQIVVAKTIKTYTLAHNQ